MTNTNAISRTGSATADDLSQFSGLARVGLRWAAEDLGLPLKEALTRPSSVRRIAETVIVEAVDASTQTDERAAIRASAAADLLIEAAGGQPAYKTLNAYLCVADRPADVEPDRKTGSQQLLLPTAPLAVPAA